MTDSVQWDVLTDEKELSARRKKAEETYRDLTGDEIKYLRKRCKTDLFFLCYGPLEYELLSPKLHGHLCRWTESTRDSRYRLFLLPRGHYKSTILTIGDSVQIALPNDANIQHSPYSYGPNVKLLLSHENRESASRFLYEIAEAFLAKELMLALFPECIPSKSQQRINKFELELPRQAHHKEPTFDTIGAGGAAQGRHYHHLKLDDMVGEDARDSETVMRRVLTWFDNVNSLLTRLKFDGWDLVGTRWGANDVYSHAIEKYGVDKGLSILYAYSLEDIQKLPHGNLMVYARGAIENGEPLFPEEFAIEDLNVLRKNRMVWAAQYANNPKDGGLTEFNKDWLRYYNVSGERLVVFDGQSSKKINIWELDRVILTDPSMGETQGSDHSGVIVTGTDKDMNVYILEVIKKRLTPPELIDLLFELNYKWAPRAVSIEEVIFSAIYRYWLEDRARKNHIHLNVVPYKPGSKKSKTARIRGLTNYFSTGQIYVQAGMHDFLDEYEWFPVGKSEHLLDALAQGPSLWDPALSEVEYQNYAELERKILEERSATTGY